MPYPAAAHLDPDQVSATRGRRQNREAGDVKREFPSTQPLRDASILDISFQTLWGLRRSL